MGRIHPAARAEDAFNAGLARWLSRRRWRLQVLPYTGYGGADFARVLGRVVLARQDQDGSDSPVAPDSRRGFWAYLAAPLREVPVTVRLGDAVLEVETDRGGYFDVELRDHGLATGWQEAQVLAGGVWTAAPVQIIGSDVTFGIVSDIDDTCVITTLPRPLVAAWNTFVLEEAARRVVPGMAPMYRALLARQPGAPIVYLSTGAWNAQPTLVRFLRRHGFPRGAMLLTDWGPTETSLFRSGRAHKRAALRRLASEFPHVRWLLVGDDGQHDPRIYEEFALHHPDHVEAIAIRQLTVTQQVLSHGAPVPYDDMTGRTSRVFTYEGPDGYALHRLLRGAWSRRPSPALTGGGHA